jgi:hypothetical protein
MMTTVERIDVGSAAKVLALVYALIWAILGLVFLLLQSALLSLLVGAVEIAGQTSYTGGRGASGGAVFGAFSFVSLLCGYLIGIVAAGVGGAVTGALVALCYNLTARLAGGLEVRISGPMAGALHSPDLLDDDLRRL